ncbi:CGNR zinc finger domain-containing protein [Actinoallomurus sp. CA-142502]|uniref:CGNR zinc finger domain-containing protein n=1 Tax=Actinoallomurus sp. CA-142502 TaxID=3239885 RepID=UPI003D91D163
MLRNVIDLLNRPPTSPDELAARWTAAGMPLDRPAGGRDLDVVLDYLTRWARLVDAATDRHRVALLNDLLSRYAGHPTVTDHDGSGWHIHYRPGGAGLAGILTAATSVAIAQHLTDRGMHRLGRCASPECGNAYIDHSRPGRQRYCSHACANRDAVRRHRQAGAA